MKLSRIYSNKPEIFKLIEFNKGLNVILAEILLPENKRKDTHNLGKTTLGSLIDFCLLSTKEKEFFLFKNLELFEDFVFFLEVHINNNQFVTIRRTVKDATKISFKKSSEGKQYYIDLSDTSWDHSNIAFEQAKKLLDGILELQAIKPWPFRAAMNYLLRSPKDFGDVFQLERMYKPSDWKPYLAHIMGFDGSLIQRHYQKEQELLEKQGIDKALNDELGVKIEDISKIDGMFLLKQQEAEKKQTLLDAFDFRDQDKIKTNQLVNEWDDKIQALNKKRYYLLQNRKKIEDSLSEEQIRFNPDDAERLFNEVGVFFQGQIKNDFNKLIEFNKSITAERRQYLSEENRQISKELLAINNELEALGKRRSDMLAFLGETDVFIKYKKISDELVNLKADINTLDRQKQSLGKLQNLRKEIRSIQEEKEKLQILIEENVDQQNANQKSFFNSIRLFFSAIIEEVISRKALLKVSLNKNCHLNFTAEILNEYGNTTSEAKGSSYQKLLCIAFDMAIARAHENDNFPHFIFHDTIFESLDNRIKVNLLNVIRTYSEKYELQQIITLIDSDLPAGEKYNETFGEDEIALLLNDKGDNGRLFKMPSW